MGGNDLIRIIKHGNKCHTKIKECPYCGCEFLYEDEDIKEQKIDIFGAVFNEEYVTCPECNSRVVVKRIAGWF